MSIMGLGSISAVVWLWEGAREDSIETVWNEDVLAVF